MCSKKTLSFLCGLIALGMLLVVAPSFGDELSLLDPPASPYLQSYLKGAHERADQNRYMVKPLLDPLTLSSQAPKPKAPYYVEFADNMEPRMVHCEEIQASWDKLASGGYCTPDLSSEQLKMWSKVCPQLQPPPKTASCKKPNILIFLVDDMGWSDFGPYGGGSTFGAATPNIDRLAREGLLLTSTYAQPSCSPTRATIHTGQLPVHNGVLSPPMYGDPGGITPQSITMPMLLKKQGYTTVGVGKWHLGESEQNLPTVVGYDEYFGFLNVSDMYSEWRDHYYNPEVAWDRERLAFMENLGFSHYLIHSKAGSPPAEQCKSLAEIVLPWEASDQTTPTKGFYPPCEKVSETAKVSISQLDQIWAEFSANFIRQQQKSTKPWYLYHATRGCHFDNYPREDFKRASYARTDYSDCQVEMDEILGYLMTTLKETGQDQDTLVFLTSDNGPELEIEPHGTTPFRGGKGDTFEGGVRVPGIARWPGMIEPGRRSDGLFDLADLYTTTLSLAGFDYASASEKHADLRQRYLYGIDQTSFLLSDQGASNRRSVLYWFTSHFAAVRMDEFKAHQMVTMPLGLREGNIGGLSGLTQEASYMWLFNLQADPKEQKNIFIRHLWNQGLFQDEFTRFEAVLQKFPPKDTTGP